MDQSIIIGVLSSLLATIIWVISGYIVTNRFRRETQILFARVFKTGVAFIYKDQDEAVFDIKKSSERSPWARILVLRGQTFFADQGVLRFIIFNRKYSEPVKFMMADPDPDPGAGVNYTARRGREVEEMGGPALEDWLESIRLLKRRAQRQESLGHLQLRLHNTPSFVRLLLFERDLYIYYYADSLRPHRGQVYRCSCDSDLYSAFRRYFELVWVNATHPEMADEAAASNRSRQ